MAAHARSFAEEVSTDPESLHIIVVPHSHWDREWYATFEQFRFYLVRFMDELIELLEEDDEFRSFLLDGQVILLEDYLHIRPENEARLRRLIREGRIDIGPWYIQPDEALVSGEALVRNLLIGDRKAREFGPVMKQGYVPDTFGHISQLPQILRGFGINTFYFMRGLGRDLRDIRSEFWWEAPDGSRVLAHNLSESYSNAAVLDSDPRKISIDHGENVSYDSLFELRDRLAERTDSDTILLLNGSDHMAVQREFSRYISGLDAAMKDRVYNGRLEDFERRIRESGIRLKSYRGELRFGRYHNVLKNVLSTRIYLKQENEAAQQFLEGPVERFSSMAFVAGARDQSAFLRHCWEDLLRNHAHDSICGCSIDEVHREMSARSRRVMQVGRKVLEESLGHLAGRVAPPARNGEIPIVVFNPSPWERGGSVTVGVLPYKAPPYGRRIFSWSGRKEITPDDYHLMDPDGREIPFEIVGEKPSVEDILNRRKFMIRVLIRFDADRIPPMGYRTYRLVPNGSSERLDPAPSGREREPVLENEYLTVRAGEDGTLAIVHKESGRVYAGMNRFVDEGDGGDEYTFSPPPEQTVLDSGDIDWRVKGGDDPHELVLSGEFELPSGLTADRRARSKMTVSCSITSRVRLRPGSRRVDIRTEFDNRALDHRLRVLFPTGLKVRESIAETAFGVVRRPTLPEDSEGWRERMSGIHGQRRFVCVEENGTGLAVLNKGLPEYEATDEGEVFLTLLRSVGWLSRDDLAVRPVPAGPAVPTPEAQCPGPQVFEYSLVPYAGGWESAGVYRHAEEIWVSLQGKAVQRDRRYAGYEPLEHASFLEIHPETVILSALKRAEEGEGLILRVFNASDKTVCTKLKFGLPLVSAQRVNLNEEGGESVEVRDNAVHLAIGGARIETLRICFARSR
ncbi:hypothetical protein E0L93_09615 [Rubrobacter taiwanensis]|jgi:mannosylglycerate hydrolase|uniref:Glycoside hydrolase family 38 central domain-containing protein n=1 Tax=Rubrobacter taiwanensis TaxID=185139 RepID=A0A4R1BI72_9ACTN|nr:glycoside hydrolase family 38 C-terminal domain-containing protein [Rubrobacter taiwanensis]TCJ16941.1 hypothetical protein E0L93_09615 [Rubrobacter taiwanensis]